MEGRLADAQHDIDREHELRYGVPPRRGPKKTYDLGPPTEREIAKALAEKKATQKELARRLKRIRRAITNFDNAAYVHHFSGAGDPDHMPEKARDYIRSRETLERIIIEETQNGPL